MEEAAYLTTEETIPMSSQTWVWKKKQNSIFPAAESQCKKEAWVQTVIPSSSQVTEESLRSDAQPQSQTTVISSIPLPGSVFDYIDGPQSYPSCAAKSVDIDEEAGYGHTKQGQPLLNKLRFSKNKLPTVTCLDEGKEKKTSALKGHIISRVIPQDNQLDGSWSEEQAYIPYRLAKLYITKIARDMHQMKTEYMKVAKELDDVKKENQEQIVEALKNQYSHKMKNLRAQLEVYQEAVDKKNQYWQNTTKSLKDENKKLEQEKETLASEIILQQEKWGKEKAWLLKSTAEKLDSLYTQHALTVIELQRSRQNLEKVQKMVDFQMDLPCDQQRATIIPNEVKTEEANNCLPQQKLMLEVKTTLEKVKETLHKREAEISELLQTERCGSLQISGT